MVLVENMDELKTAKIFGQLGLFILILVLLYLILKIIGIVHSITIEEILVGVVLGQLFYSGYTYRAIEEIRDLKKRVKKIERKLKV